MEILFSARMWYLRSACCVLVRTLLEPRGCKKWFHFLKDIQRCYNFERLWKIITVSMLTIHALLQYSPEIIKSKIYEEMKIFRLFHLTFFFFCFYSPYVFSPYSSLVFTNLHCNVLNRRKKKGEQTGNKPSNRYSFHRVIY